MKRDLLMIPEPTKVAPAVLEAMAKPPVSHMSLKYAETLREGLKGLAEVIT